MMLFKCAHRQNQCKGKSVSIRSIVEIWPGCSVKISVIYVMNRILWAISIITPSLCAAALNHSNIITSLIVVTNKLDHIGFRSPNDNSDAKVVIAQIHQLCIFATKHGKSLHHHIIDVFVKYSCLSFCWIWAAAPQYFRPAHVMLVATVWP